VIQYELVVNHKAIPFPFLVYLVDDLCHLCIDCFCKKMVNCWI